MTDTRYKKGVVEAYAELVAESKGGNPGNYIESAIKFVDEHDICYFGKEIDGDPMGTPMKAEAIKLVKEFSDG